MQGSRNTLATAIKAGAQSHAAELGLMLVTLDTSPRGTAIEGADAAWDFGTAAGFYLDATEAPWSRHWPMGSYVARELRALVLRHFPACDDQVGLLSLGTARLDRTHQGWGTPAAAVDRPGPERQTSDGAIAPGVVRGRLRRGRPAAHVASPRRLRPQLLLYLDLHQRPPCASRQGFDRGQSLTAVGTTPPISRRHA